MKKLHGFILAGTLTLSFVSGVMLSQKQNVLAKADGDDSYLYIGSTHVDINDPEHLDQGWSYDYATNTLTLAENFNLEDSDNVEDMKHPGWDGHETKYFYASIAYFGDKDFNINVTGSNATITSLIHDEETIETVIYSASNINLYGPGSLSISKTNKCLTNQGIVTPGPLNIDIENLNIYIRDAGNERCLQGSTVYINGGTITLDCGYDDNVTIGVSTDMSHLYVGEVTRLTIMAKDPTLLCTTHNDVPGFGIDGDDNKIDISINKDGYDLSGFNFKKIQFESQNKKDAKAVEDEINAIATPITLDSASAISNARSHYDALSETAKPFVSEECLDKLIGYEAELVSLKIDAIPEPKDVTADYKDTIISVKAEYDALSDSHKAKIDEEHKNKINTLVQAIEDAAAIDAEIDKIGVVKYPDSYDQILKCTDLLMSSSTGAEAFLTKKDVYDKATALYFKYLFAVTTVARTEIDKIGEVELTDECKARIDTARAAFDLVAERDQHLIQSSKDKLIKAEEDYQALVDAKAQGDDVSAKISDIGEVSYPGSGDKINLARTSYDALSELAQGYVTNYQTLLDAEHAYEELKQDGIDDVKALISAIGNLDYSEEFNNKLIAARNAYEALTDEQKEAVDNYHVLESDELSYRSMDKFAKKVAAIGEVDLNSGDALVEAREDYNSLSEEEKALVSDYESTLVAKEEKYQQLVAEKVKHDKLIMLAIILGSVGGFIFLLALIYVLLFFAFNKWVVIDNKPVRVLKLSSKEGKVKVMKPSFKVLEVNEKDISNKK